jgi:hypothetical protein
VVGSDGFYKGVPVFPLTKPLDIDLEIDIEYETVYMQPIDELVLSSLGKLLLKRNYPSFLSTPEKESFLHGLSSRSNVKALHTYSEFEPLRASCLLLLIYEETFRIIAGEVLKQAPCYYLFAFVCSYLLQPFVYCINEDGLMLPPQAQAF